MRTTTPAAKTAACQGLGLSLAFVPVPGLVAAAASAITPPISPAGDAIRVEGVPAETAAISDTVTIASSVGGGDVVGCRGREDGYGGDEDNEGWRTHFFGQLKCL
jgi:hypothetical protein